MAHHILPPTLSRRRLHTSLNERASLGATRFVVAIYRLPIPIPRNTPSHMATDHSSPTSITINSPVACGEHARNSGHELSGTRWCMAILRPPSNRARA